MFDKIDLRYSNYLLFLCVWIITAVLFSSLFFLPFISKFAEWLVIKFNGIGLILVIILSLILVFGIFIGSLIIAIKKSDKKGTVEFYEDYIEIIAGTKNIKIYYTEIIKMEYTGILKNTILANLHGKDIYINYILKIKAKNKNIKIRSSIKEYWENRKKDYKSALEEVYDKIELNIALKNEPE